jgi:phage baseplate assembly protein W
MKGINIKFPLKDDPEKNVLFKQNFVSKDALLSNLLLLLLTDTGERFYMPDYGTNLKKFIFEPKDNTTQTDILEDVKKSVSRFMPEVTITNVRFYGDGIDEQNEQVSDHELKVYIDFVYSNDVFSEPGSLELTF